MQTKKLEISFYLPSSIEKHKIIFLFQFETKLGEMFGDSLIAIIDIGIPLEQSMVDDDIIMSGQLPVN
jgi:hypothetical protein